MKVWIEIYKQHHGGRLSCQWLSKLVREDRRDGYANVTKREIDLAYGLKDRHESIFTLFI